MVASHRSPERPGILAACAVLLALATGVAYRSLLRNDFVLIDDQGYIVGNANVTGGLSLAAVSWAFRSQEQSNWHPLTWLSHMLDCQMFGLNPVYHHLHNLLLHGVNALLLLWVLRSMTGSVWRSALVAALFALHPLHVESVAWASERKDVLSTFFGLLALWAYIGYVRLPASPFPFGRYLLVLLLFAFSLLSKPMLVTLPFLLLLLDGWPLGRWAWRAAVVSRLVLEKLPLLCLSITSSLATVAAQSRGGAVAPLEQLSLGSRLGNCVVGYSFYIYKMIWPARLMFMYLRPPGWPAGVLLGSVLLLMLGSLLSVWAARRRPAVLIGWLWYLGTAVPVIGLLQVGVQFAADRYTYFPLIGLFMALVWVLPEEWLADARSRVVAGVVCSLTLGALLLCTHRQVAYWRSSLSLFQHGVDLAPGNAMAHYSLANALSVQGDADQAIGHYREALRIEPKYAEAHFGLANALARRGVFDEERSASPHATDEALEHYIEGLRLKPDKREWHTAVRAYLRQSGMSDPDIAVSLYRLGRALDAPRSMPEAIGYYREAVRLDPALARAHNDLGAALASIGELGTAIVYLAEALRLRPDSKTARTNLILALSRYADIGESQSAYPANLRQAPPLAQAEQQVADALSRAGQVAEAQVHYQAARRLAPHPPQ